MLWAAADAADVLVTLMLLRWCRFCAERAGAGMSELACVLALVLLVRVRVLVHLNGAARVGAQCWAC